MKINKSIVLGLLISLLFTITNLTGCIVGPEKALQNFSKRIEQGNINNLTLTFII
jgi:nitrate/nitrite-specific signal transduction histidine kinase